MSLSTPPLGHPQLLLDMLPLLPISNARLCVGQHQLCKSTRWEFCDQMRWCSNAHLFSTRRWKRKGELLASFQPSHPHVNPPLLDSHYGCGPLPSVPPSAVLLLFPSRPPTQDAKTVLHLMQEVESHTTFCELLGLWGNQGSRNIFESFLT